MSYSFNIGEDAGSPLTPIPTLEQSSFRFSPSFLSDTYLQQLQQQQNQQQQQQRLDRRSFTPVLDSSATKSPGISPIEFNYSGNNLNVIQKPGGFFGSQNNSNNNNNAMNYNSPIYDISVELPQQQNRFNSFNMNPSNCNKNTNNTIVQPSNKLGAISKRENNNNSYLEHTLSIKTILTEIGMEKYCEIFHKEEVDLDLFFELNEGDLIEIGINNQNDRNVIISAILDFNYSHWVKDLYL